MLIWWRVRFNGGDTHGYQVMDAGLNCIGVYDDAGNLVPNPGDYTTTDSGPSPEIGVTPPAWADQVHA